MAADTSRLNRQNGAARRYRLHWLGWNDVQPRTTSMFIFAIEGIVDPVSTAFRRVNKSDDVLVNIHRFEQEALALALVAYSREASASGAVETPHLESRVQKSSIREQIVQTLHGMEAIDRLLALPVATVVRAVFDLAFLQQAQALYGAIRIPAWQISYGPHIPTATLHQLANLSRVGRDRNLFPALPGVPVQQAGMITAPNPSNTHRVRIVPSKSCGSQLMVKAPEVALL